MTNAQSPAYRLSDNRRPSPWDCAKQGHVPVPEGGCLNCGADTTVPISRPCGHHGYRCDYDTCPDVGEAMTTEPAYRTVADCWLCRGTGTLTQSAAGSVTPPFACPICSAAGGKPAAMTCASCGESTDDWIVDPDDGEWELDAEWWKDPSDKTGYACSRRCYLALLPTVGNANSAGAS